MGPTFVYLGIGAGAILHDESTIAKDLKGNKKSDLLATRGDLYNKPED